MAKEPQGSCNRCGHCGCYEGAGGPAKWYPGIGGGHMKYGQTYPDRDSDICSLIRTAFMAKFGQAWDNDYGFEVDISVVGGGPKIDVTCYISERGIQKAPSDASCPFFEVGTPNACLIWERDQWPDACRNTPYFTSESQIEAWQVNHPHTSQGGLCGFYWIDV